MHTTSREPLRLDPGEVAIVGTLLESERSKLERQMRHAENRAAHEELRRRLKTVERLMERCHAAVSAE